MPDLISQHVSHGGAIQPSLKLEPGLLAWLQHCLQQQSGVASHAARENARIALDCVLSVSLGQTCLRDCEVLCDK